MRFATAGGKLKKQLQEEQPGAKKRKSSVKSSNSHVSLSKSLYSRQIRREVVKFRRSVVNFRDEVIKISVRSSDSVESRQVHSKIIETAFLDIRRCPSLTHLRLPPGSVVVSAMLVGERRSGGWRRRGTEGRNRILTIFL
jgi:hypothetical protein